MGANFNFNEKFFSWVMSIAFIVCLYFLISTYSDKIKMQKSQTEIIEKMKKEKELTIKANYIYIDSLKRELIKSDIIINRANSTIDSLQHEKNKIKIVYVEKIKEIKGYDSGKIIEYWKNEFEK